MERVVGTDQEVGADRGELVGGSEHQLTHALPVTAIDARHVVGERMTVQRDLRMRVCPEQRGAFDADGAVAQRRALGGAGDDADMRWHQVRSRKVTGDVQHFGAVDFSGHGATMAPGWRRRQIRPKDLPQDKRTTSRHGSCPIVMAWLGHAIHVFAACSKEKTWMAGLRRP